MSEPGDMETSAADKTAVASTADEGDSQQAQATNAGGQPEASLAPKAVVSLLEQVQEWDESRPSLPGEHWLTALLGLTCLLVQPRYPAARALSLVAGMGLLARAATGRDGLIAYMERQARVGSGGFHEVAAVWPYEDRVRLSDPRRVD